jgi:hypothetical protein
VVQQPSFSADVVSLLRDHTAETPTWLWDHPGGELVALEPGAERIVWRFSRVLGHSRMMWARFVAQQDLATVLRCHVAAFEAVGGVPEVILYDRMRTASACRGRPAPSRARSTGSRRSSEAGMAAPASRCSVPASSTLHNSATLHAKCGM